RTAVEELLVGIWGEVLGVEKVGVHDNFFDLGGDSIKAAILTNRLQETLGEIIHVVALFDSPTVAGLAAHLDVRSPQAVERLSGTTDAQGFQPHGLIPWENRVDLAKVARLRERILDRGSDSADSSAARNRRAVFLLSPPRSGSTLLRVMLA